jgi:hypothetical protein
MTLTLHDLEDDLQRLADGIEEDGASGSGIEELRSTLSALQGEVTRKVLGVPRWFRASKWKLRFLKIARGRLPVAPKLDVGERSSCVIGCALSWRERD